MITEEKLKKSEKEFLESVKASEEFSAMLCKWASEPPVVVPPFRFINTLN